MKSILLVLTLSFYSWAFAKDLEEEILGVTYDSTGVTFQVATGGCTSKSDFNFRILEIYPPQYILIRTKPDVCDAFFPYGKMIKFTYDELGLKKGNRFHITNKLIDRRIVY